MASIKDMLAAAQGKLDRQVAELPDDKDPIDPLFMTTVVLPDESEVAPGKPALTDTQIAEIYADRVLNGMSVFSTAMKHNVTPREVRFAVDVYSARVPLDSVGALRRVELARLDVMVEKIMPGVLAGDTKSIETMMAIMKLRHDYVPYLKVNPKQGETSDDPFAAIASALGVSPEEARELVESMNGEADFGKSETVEP